MAGAGGKAWVAQRGQGRQLLPHMVFDTARREFSHVCPCYFWPKMAVGQAVELMFHFASQTIKFQSFFNKKQ
jgi:hypothetical protein